MDRRYDPRTIVTPYAFSVHPELLGRPLATPWQRLGAIGIDLVVIFGLTRIGGTTLAIATGLLLFWLAIRKPAKDAFGWVFRSLIGCLGVLVLGITVLAVWGRDYVDRLGTDPQAQAELRSLISGLTDSAGVDLAVGTGEGTDSLQLGDLLVLVPNLFALRSAEDGSQAREIARSAAATAQEGGVPLSEIRGALEDFMPTDAPWSGEADDIIDEVLAELSLRVSEPPTPGQAQAGDSLQGLILDDPAAQDSISALTQRLLTVEQERLALKAQLDHTEIALREAENRGILDRIKEFMDDLGLGFGWAALYLTITHTWWKGRSVGKKIFRTRVVMIDNRPLNLWLSFERAGGYAAGFATGLLGFAQIFWDPNRQAIHDKVSETFVIQDGKSPVPGPWIAEGTAQWDRHRSRRAEAGD